MLAHYLVGLLGSLGYKTYLLSPSCVPWRGFLCKYAGGTLRDTLSRAFPPPVYYMTKYEFLMEEKEAGRLKKWLQLGAPSQLPKWMEIYQYHLLHFELSQLELSTDLNVGHSTIQRALAYMTQELV